MQADSVPPTRSILRSRLPLIRAVLLDVDGTLVRSNDLHAACWNDVLVEHGYPTTFAQIRKLIGMGSDKIIEVVTGRRKEEMRELLEARTALFMRIYLPRILPQRGARVLLDRLHERGLKLMVASSASKQELEGILRVAQLDDLLPHRTCSDDADASKPDPDIVLAALNKLGVQADDAIMLGDTPYDVAAARQAGVRMIGLRCGGWDDPALAGAWLIRRDPADLATILPTLWSDERVDAAS